MTMKKKVFGAAAAMMIVSGAAGAADMYGQPRLGGYSWTGPYVGANLGYQWGSTTNNGTRPSGLAGGLQAGYNMQRDQFVFGAETDLQLSGADETFATWKFSNPWFGTLRARAGVTFNSNFLFYGTFGLAYGGLKAHSNLAGVSESKTHLGWAVGAGMEVAIAGNWSAKAEYLYIDLSDRAYALTGVSNGLESSLLRMGVNYRF